MRKNTIFAGFLLASCSIFVSACKHATTLEDTRSGVDNLSLSQNTSLSNKEEISSKGEADDLISEPETDDVTIISLEKVNSKKTKSKGKDSSDGVDDSESTPISESSFVLTGAYATIAEATRSNSLLAGRARLKASEHNLKAHKKSLLPQITPNASVNVDGDTVASLHIDQVLFDSGRYSANKKVLLSEQDNVAANLKIEEGEKIANAISAYIQYHRAREAQALSSETAKIYAKLEKQASRRVMDGVGDNSEQALFNLKKIEAEAEHDGYLKEAFTSAQRLKRYANIEMPDAKPSRMNLTRGAAFAPRIELAASERDQAESRLDFEKAERLPRVAIMGDVGTATDSFDAEDLNLRLNLSVNKPLSWGVDHGLASSRSELEATRIAYENTKKEIHDSIAILKMEIRQEENKIKRLKGVKSASQKRLRDFDERFLAGRVGIVEVASIIETYKKSKMQLIDSKYSIHNLELELAELNGALVD